MLSGDVAHPVQQGHDLRRGRSEVHRRADQDAVGLGELVQDALESGIFLDAADRIRGKTAPAGHARFDRSIGQREKLRLQALARQDFQRGVHQNIGVSFPPRTTRNAQYLHVCLLSFTFRGKKGGRKIGFHAKAGKGAKISLRLDTNARGENLRCRLRAGFTTPRHWNSSGTDTDSANHDDQTISETGAGVPLHFPRRPLVPRECGRSSCESPLS